MLSLCVPAIAVSKSELTSAVTESASYMLNAVAEPMYSFAKEEEERACRNAQDHDETESENTTT